MSSVAALRVRGRRPAPCAGDHDAEPVVHGERTDRPDVAVGVVAVLPGRDVALLVVAGVVADHPAGDAACTPLATIGVGQRLEAGGDVALGLALRLQERGVVAGGEHRVAPADEPELVDGAVGGPPGATTRVWNVESGPRIDSAAAATSSFWVDAPMSGVSASWVATAWSPAATTKQVPSPGGCRRARPAGAARRPLRRPARARAAPTTTAWRRPAWGGRRAGAAIAARERDDERETAPTRAALATTVRYGCSSTHQTAVSRSPQNSSRSTRLSSLPDSVRGSSSRTS